MQIRRRKNGGTQCFQCGADLGQYNGNRRVCNDCRDVAKIRRLIRNQKSCYKHYWKHRVKALEMKLHEAQANAGGI